MLNITYKSSLLHFIWRSQKLENFEVGRQLLNFLLDLVAL